MRYFFTLLCLLAVFLVHAQDTLPQFAFPLDCTLGETCLTVNYVDVDPTDEHKDFQCTSKTTDDHKGTDFAIKSRAAMMSGVNVLAARNGTVARVRDGETDAIKTEAGYRAIHEANKDCGNGILIDHGQGLQTFYCHVKNGSITVKPGDTVAKGQAIAQVGQSGYAEFPHLHFSVIWEGGHVDPFTGMLKESRCGQMKDNMWETDITYEPFTVFDNDFSAAVPDFETMMREGAAASTDPITTDAPSLLYWVGFYHARVGDTVTLTITDPDGAVFKTHETTLQNNRKRPSFLYSGRQLNAPLKAGDYKGTATFKRGGVDDYTVTRTITVAPAAIPSADPIVDPAP